MSKPKYTKKDFLSLVKPKDSPLFYDKFIGKKGLAGALLWPIILEDWNAAIKVLIRYGFEYKSYCQTHVMSLLREWTLEDMPLYVTHNGVEQQCFPDHCDYLPCMKKPAIYGHRCDRCAWLARWRLERGK